MTDQEIIREIQKGKLEKPIQFLYKEFPKIRLLLLKEGGQDEQIQEIFNDSLVLLIEKVTPNSFELTSKMSTFLTGINRFLLKNELRKNNKEIHISNPNFELELGESFEYDFEYEEKLKRVDYILDTIQERCKSILHFFYFEKRSMEYIAEKMGFSSVNSAKTQKYKCLEKAHQLALETSIHPENSEI